jgi:DNA-binding transcriptional regulator YiaG
VNRVKPTTVLPPPDARAIRDSLGLTQPQMVELLGTTVETISRYETGRVPVSGPTRSAYLALLRQPDLVQRLKSLPINTLGPQCAS